MVPKNQPYWRSGERAKLFTNKINGYWYATLGAGPLRQGCNGVLVSDINRYTDVREPPSFPVRRLAVPQEAEDDKIGLLLNRDSNYRDDLPYACLPDIPFSDNTYNSNGYAHGLLNAAGIEAQLPVGGGYFVGWTKPVPSSQFDPHP